MIVTLYLELRVVVRLRQEANGFVAERFEKLNLVEGEARHDGIAALAGVLDGAEPEELVLDDRAADGAAELLAVEGRLDDVARLEQVRVGVGEQLRRVGVEPVVAEKPEDRAAETVAAALGDDRKQRAARAPIGRREALRRQRKLLYALHREVLQDAADGVVFIVAAVDGDVEVAARRAAD